MSNFNNICQTATLSFFWIFEFLRHFWVGELWEERQFMPFLDNTYFWVNFWDLRDKIGQKLNVAVWSYALWSFLRKKKCYWVNHFLGYFFSPHPPQKKRFWRPFCKKKWKRNFFFIFFIFIDRYIFYENLRFLPPKLTILESWPVCPLKYLSSRFTTT